MSNNTTTTKIEINTGSYNDRRYGKPWIAKVTFDDNGKAAFEWGTWVGRPGYSGTLVIHAAEGEIVAKGQKDNRNSRGTECDYYQVQGGQLVAMSKAEAYKASREYVAQVAEVAAEAAPGEELFDLWQNAPALSETPTEQLEWALRQIQAELLSRRQ